MYMIEAFKIRSKIKQMSISKDVGVNVRLMANWMKKKYDKYWGNVDCLNMTLMISFKLHPRFKLKFTNWLFAESFDGELGQLSCDLRDKVEFRLRSLFEENSGSKKEFEASS